ncbi:plasma membrane proteolipid Pmp3 [Elasticomyces elasticus]|nr:plasma membrane proteolipid Pmp3 [Elasticomyces elasticus]KAK4988664.1 plasma membrane proteolipid Pmp3 [Elasticomyces elasticus]
MPLTGSDIIKIVIAVILPPLGVFLERGCGADLLINILLTVLGYIPGIIHALYVKSYYQNARRSMD